MTAPRRKGWPYYAERHRKDAYDYAEEIRQKLRRAKELTEKIDDYANAREELRHEMSQKVVALLLESMDLASQVQLGMVLAGQGPAPEDG